MCLTADQIATLRQSLLGELQTLDAAETLGKDGQRTVELDQQAVGRLSRMDALQHQAMSRATHGNRQVRRRAVEAALARIETGDYGWCCTCGEPIPPRRLEIDAAAAVCVSCAG